MSVSVNTPHSHQMPSFGSQLLQSPLDTLEGLFVTQVNYPDRHSEFCERITANNSFLKKHEDYKNNFSLCFRHLFCLGMLMFKTI